MLDLLTFFAPILVKLGYFFANKTKKSKMKKDQNPLDPQIAAFPLKNLKLSIRLFNTLKRANIHTIGQLARSSEQDLLNLNHFGPKSLQELRNSLSNMGLENVLSSSPPQSKQTLFSVFQITDFPLDLAGVSIGVIGLSKRAHNQLERSGIWTLGDLGQSNLNQIQQIKNIGQRAIREIQQAFCELDLTQLRAKVLAHCPNTQVQLRLTFSSLPEDIKKALKQAKIKKVADLCQLSLNEWEQLGLSADQINKIDSELKTHYIKLILPTSGLTTESNPEAVGSISDSTDQINSSGGPSSKVSPSVLDSTLSDASTTERIEQMLAQLPERQAQVLRWRYGLDGNKPLTLEEVGTRLGVTRQRVRQIQKHTTSKLQRPRYRRIIEPLIDLLEQALEKKYGLLSVEMAQNVLCAEDPKIPISSESLLEFILRFTGRRIERLKKNPFITLNRPPYDKYHHQLFKILLTFDKILKEAHAPLPEDQILERFMTKKKAQGITNKVSTDYLKACLDVYPEIEINQDGEYTLKRWRKSVIDDMIVVLRKHGKPLHYKEIATGINERVSKKQQTTARNIHIKLGYYRDLFIRVGHGIFGLAEWDLKQDRTLADAAVRILHEVGHVLTISELTDKVLETWHVKRGSVQAAIHLEPRIVRVGYNLYSLADSEQNQEQGIEDD